jgi:hypothetical protein
MLIAGNLGGNGCFGGGEPLIVLPPEHAETFNRDGYTKEKVKAEIYARATLPLDRISTAMLAKLDRQKDATSEVIRVAQRPDDIMIIVAGGVGVKAAYVPTWGGTTRAVSRQIRRGKGVREN